MFEKIMVISEFIPNYEFVLHSMRSLKKLGAKQCCLYQFLDPRVVNETISTYILDIYRSDLEQQKNILLEHSFETEVKESTGLMTVEDVNQITGDEGFSLIVTGSSKHTKFGWVLAGGAAQTVMHGCTTPLLIVRLPEERMEIDAFNKSSDLTQHILFPTDFSENANQVFEYVKDMVRAGVSKISLVHVQEKDRIEPHLTHQLDEFNKTDLDRLQQMAEQLKEIGPVDVSIAMPYGSPTGEVLKMIQEQQVSLVVMGSQGRGWIKEIYLGSVSHNIARHASSSVLLIPLASKQPLME